jgi:hypothetical protein
MANFVTVNTLFFASLLVFRLFLPNFFFFEIFSFFDEIWIFVLNVNHLLFHIMMGDFDVWENALAMLLSFVCVMYLGIVTNDFLTGNMFFFTLFVIYL